MRSSSWLSSICGATMVVGGVGAQQPEQTSSRAASTYLEVYDALMALDGARGSCTASARPRSRTRRSGRCSTTNAGTMERW
jgi:hypothetical protein